MVQVISTANHRDSIIFELQHQALLLMHSILYAYKEMLNVLNGRCFRVTF